jgi:hypothetical protein
MQSLVPVQQLGDTSFLLLRGARFLTDASEQAWQSLKRRSKSQAPNPEQIQELKVKNKNDKSKPKNVVRGSSLVPGSDCTTLKGRTTIVFGTYTMKLPRFARHDRKNARPAMTPGT